MILNGQFTDQINSNRPGTSIGAYSVGRGVLQVENGIEYRTYKHQGYNNTVFNGGLGALSLRWGVLSEELEFIYSGSFLAGQFNTNQSEQSVNSFAYGLLENYVGFKLLIYDPFKNQQENTNLYSWKSNRSFRLRNLIPALSISFGTNFNLMPNNPFAFGNIYHSFFRPLFFSNLGLSPPPEATLTVRILTAAQFHPLPRWALVTNFMYDRIRSGFPTTAYTITLIHNLMSSWIIYIENSEIFGEFEFDSVFRTGVAKLLNNNMQIEASMGINTKNTPQFFFFSTGFSFRLVNRRNNAKTTTAKEEAAF